MPKQSEILKNYKELEYFKPISQDVMSEIMNLTEVIEFEEGSEILKEIKILIGIQSKINNNFINSK